MPHRAHIRQTILSWAPLLCSVLGMLLVTPVSASSGLLAMQGDRAAPELHFDAGYHLDPGLSVDAHLECEAGAEECEEDERAQDSSLRADAPLSLPPVAPVQLQRTCIDVRSRKLRQVHRLPARGPPAP